MTNQREKNDLLLFAIIGIIFLVIGVFVLFNYIKFKEKAVKTDATISNITTSYDSDGDSHHSVYVEFMVNGKKYSGSLNAYHIGMHKGGTTSIYYNPDNPDEFKSPSDIWAGMIFALLGGAATIIGFFPYIKTIRHNKLMKCSEVVYADFDRVIINKKYSYNGSFPFKIVCYANEFEGVEFLSDNLWQNPENYIQEKNITTFKVYVNPSNPNDYYMPLEEINNYLV